jgi:hypothetical protein
MPLHMLLMGLSLPRPCVYCYVIHVDCNVPFVDKVTEYSVHYHLESGWGVGEAEEHHCWFIKSFIGDECRFPLVLLFDEDFVISPLNVQTW